MRLTPAQAAKLARLADGESLPRSWIPKVLLGPLQEAGVVRVVKSGASYVVRSVPGKPAGFVEHRTLLAMPKLCPTSVALSC